MRIAYLKAIEPESVFKMNNQDQKQNQTGQSDQQQDGRNQKPGQQSQTPDAGKQASQQGGGTSPQNQK